MSPVLYRRPRKGFGISQTACRLLGTGLFLLWQCLELQAQTEGRADYDPCGYDSLQAVLMLKAFGPGWGYNYDSLLVDLSRWAASPYVRIDSVGASVQNRALWMLTITNDAVPAMEKYRVWMHARTHPLEVQGWWVTDAVINMLLEESPLGQFLRDHIIFHIMPMYNPDGVELGLARQNANGVDLESNWAANPSQPEVQVLRRLFTTFMSDVPPIRIALNMHASFRCRRFFVYHDAAGTSAAFAEDQKRFIGSIRSYWPEGIEPWYYFVSWTGGTPPVYPESWFWMNHREAVMALTYEDMNCPQAGEYDRTAAAIVQGLMDYLGLQQPTAITGASSPPADFALLSLFPNPAPGDTPLHVQLRLPQSAALTLELFNVLGQKLAAVSTQHLPAGVQRIVLPFDAVGSGTYWLSILGPDGRLVAPVTVLK